MCQRTTATGRLHPRLNLRLRSGLTSHPFGRRFRDRRSKCELASVASARIFESLQLAAMASAACTLGLNAQRRHLS